MNPIMRPAKVLALAVCLAVIPPALAADLLPADRPIAEVIDHYVSAKLKEAGVTPAPPADEATIVRRLTLDLAGRIPTPAEVQAYLQSQDPQKRAQLIEQLMASPWYVRHAAIEFNTMLRGPDLTGPDLRPYLLAAFKENRPWDQMFREMMGVAEAAHKPEAFVLQRLKDPDVLTRDVSSLFFGINISCAQCHRHPYVKSLTQDYFFGMKAFFSRSYDFQGKLLEKQYTPRMQYKNKAGEMRDVQLLFLTGTTVAEPAADVPDLTKAIQEETKRIAELQKGFAKNKEYPPAPAFSYRKQLVEVALRPENQELLARSIVNRLWYRFHGHGLVMRVDQMHSENPPSHPELLQWLTRDLIAHNYDLRRLVQGLVSGQAYARSSRWDRGTAPAPELFAVANLRPLTPMQFGMSQRLASDPGLLKTAPAGEAFDKQAAQWEGEALRVFGRIIEEPQEGFQVNATEALILSNDPNVLKMLGDKLTPHLTKLPDRRQQVEQAVWAALSRPPTVAEVRVLSDYVDGHAGPDGKQLQPTLQQMVWALLTSAEFRFNH